MGRSMVQQEQDKVLADTERVAGRQALRNNVAAAVALADAVRSTLGPKGLDKLLSDIYSKDIAFL